MATIFASVGEKPRRIGWGRPAPGPAATDRCDKAGNGPAPPVTLAGRKSGVPQVAVAGGAVLPAGAASMVVGDGLGAPSRSARHSAPRRTMPRALVGGPAVSLITLSNGGCGLVSAAAAGLPRHNAGTRSMVGLIRVDSPGPGSPGPGGICSSFEPNSTRGHGDPGLVREIRQHVVREISPPQQNTRTSPEDASALRLTMGRGRRRPRAPIAVARKHAAPGPPAGPVPRPMTNVFSLVRMPPKAGVRRIAHRRVMERAQPYSGIPCRRAILA